MDKLTQFVSKSFENNNNNNAGEQCLNLSFEAKSFEASPSVKSEKEYPEEHITRKPKNWLISDIEKSPSPTHGCIDLRLHSDNSKSNDKCEKIFQTAQEPLSAELKTVDTNDSKMCTEHVNCEKQEDSNEDTQCDDENSDHKICKCRKSALNLLFGALIPLKGWILLYSRFASLTRTFQVDLVVIAAKYPRICFIESLQTH
ncbi:hypothetical protein D910_11523 [Dendroctonus ponderosae]|uniref:Uncharacterized protein n=1 Tax=Dendroctonus ponderosae TaxID=77166 RepID=U4UMA0_DENPD|nr:hypothetical protein D910_11523 [Dendroctonus ponderosae]